ncbi:MAG: hypothetical protein KF845_04330 [Cyclobacteriaceae bacterium]|nr:hypothetical protein [Cyclobacteriaceae bacterium]
MRILTTGLLLGIALASAAQVFHPERGTDSITITYRDLAFKKKNKDIKGRVQVRTTANATWLMANDFGKLPAFFKKFTLSDGNSRYRFTRSQLLPGVQPVLDAAVEEIKADTIFFTDAARKKKLLQSYPRHRDRFFSGGNGGLFFRHNWIPLYTAPAALNEPVTLHARGLLFRKARYQTDRLPTGYAPELPVINPALCAPYNRFHELRKMQGYGLGNFKYISYRPFEREAVRHSFEIYFEKNSAEAKPESVQRVIEFLRSNNYSILNATIEGYSSVEGSEQNNERLQHRRARILLQALRLHNNEPIVSDTVIVRHGYDLFRQAIRETPYRWLDTLDNETLRTTLNTNAVLLGSVEPYLGQHRKASLKLVVAKKLESEEVFNRFKRDFSYWERQLDPRHSRGASPAEVESRIMGMMEYMFDLMMAGQITPRQLAEVVDGAVNNKLVRVLSVYHEIILFERQNSRDSLAWDQYSKAHKFTNSFLLAQSNLIGLITEPGIHHRHVEKFRRQLVDIQTYTFDYVRNGWLSLEALCRLDYPDSPKFRGYKLNQLAFLQHMTQFGEVPCEKLTLAKEHTPDTYDDSWLDNLQQETGYALTAKLPNGKYLPSFGSPVYSPLLFYLKKLFLNKEPSIRQHVITSDNFYEFDVYTLARYSVDHWQPALNFFQDREIQLGELNDLILLLKKINKNICPNQTNQLYLDYHLKALHYLSVYYEPGNQRQTEIVQQSMRFIAQYYSRNASKITPRLSLYLLHQFNAFHTLPGRYDGTWHAWNMLKSITAQRVLTQPEADLLEKYNRYFTIHKS